MAEHRTQEDMARVAIYVHDFRPTGVVRNALSIAERLLEEHDVTVIAGYGSGLLAPLVSGAGYDVRTLRSEPKGFARRLAVVPRLRATLRELQPDILLSRGSLGHVSAYWATRGISRPSRIYVISNEVVNRPGSFLKKKRVERLLADAARVIIIGSRQAATEPFLSAVRSARARYIPNGTDIATAHRLAREPVSHPWFDDRSMPVALAIGRIHRQKNYERLIQALQIANAERPMRLIVIGGGPAAYKERLVALAAREGVGDRVDFVGETINVHPWLADADVFVLPSLWEGGAAMVLLEALAADVPVVASLHAGDTAAVLDGGRYGAIVDAEDPASIAAGLLRQLRADAMRPRGRAQDYPLKRTLDEYAALVNEVVLGADLSATFPARSFELAQLASRNAKPARPLDPAT